MDSLYPLGEVEFAERKFWWSCACVGDGDSRQLHFRQAKLKRVFPCPYDNATRNWLWPIPASPQGGREPYRAKTPSIAAETTSTGCMPSIPLNIPWAL